MKLETTLIAGKPLRYSVRRSRRARRLGLTVCHRQGVEVVLPWRARLSDVPDLLKRFSGWLVEQADKYEVWDGPKVRSFATGSTVDILGRARRLEISGLPAGKSRPQVHLEGDALHLQLSAEDIFEPRPALQKYLRKLARADLLERVEHWSDRLGLYPTKVIVGERTSRWGSCSRQGTLSFCYRLIQAPPEVIDAVVAHEVCHLAHLNHGKRFYALLDRVCPDHRRCMDWLRDHDQELLL